MSRVSVEPQQETEYRVSTLELFFDLVFVFTITQLTRKLADDTSPLGFGHVVIMLFVILWMYFGYVWLTWCTPGCSSRRRSGFGGGDGAARAVQPRVRRPRVRRRFPT